MVSVDFEMDNSDMAWCPGCGNYQIHKIIEQALGQLHISPTNLVIASGIGQAAKMPQYVKNNMFNGLHGRALPAATAIKAANRSLVVIAESGDGDMYGEGGNHFIHTIRRNPDITNIVHNNMVYGLTKGQASPTSRRGFVTPVQVKGVFAEPFNPLAVAIALDASFVARAFAGHRQETTEIIKLAIEHKGYALVDIFQPCVIFNKVNTYQWFKDHTYYLKDHDATDRNLAFAKAVESDKLPLGVFYNNSTKATFGENISKKSGIKTALYKHRPEMQKLSDLIDSFKTSL